MTLTISLVAADGATGQITIPGPVVTAPPPPPTGTIIAPKFTPTDANAITTFGFTPFEGAAPANFVTFACPLVDGALMPTDGVAIGGVPAQMDVASTYPSGAVRHALLAVPVPALAAGATWVGSLVKVAKAAGSSPMLSCGVVVTITPAGGAPVSVDLWSAFANGVVDLFRSGPIVTEGRVRVPVPGVDHLELVADLQCFVDGTHRIDVIFARETVNIVPMPSTTMPKAPTITYGATITDNGVQTFAVAAVSHDMGQRWTPTFATGITQPTHVQFDVAYLRATGAMIHDPSLGVTASVVSSYVAKPAVPMTAVNGAMNGVLQYMGQTGGRGDIGPEPTPVAVWLVTQDPRAAHYALWNAEGARTIPWHWRDATTGSYMSITDHPTLWYPPLSASWGMIGPDVFGAGTGGWSIDDAHEPDSSFVAWLLTGRRAAYDDLMAQATQQEYGFNPDRSYRNGSAGHFLTSNTTSYEPQDRSQAWMLRQLVQAAVFARDDDRLKPHITGWVNTNLDALVAFLPALKLDEGEPADWIPGGYGTPNVFASWQQDYLAGALATAYSAGFPQAWTILDAMMGFLAGSMLTPDFYARDCCAYNVPVGGPPNAPTIRTWAAMRDALVAAGGSGGGTAWAPNTFVAYYAARRGVLEYMAARGHAQAQHALSWLKLVANAADKSFGATDAYAVTDPTFFIK